MRKHYIKIRPDTEAVIFVPSDLSTSEAEYICEYLKTWIASHPAKKEKKK